MEVILYSTHCPRCEILKKTLDKNNVIYEEVNDVSAMLEKGFNSAPMLEIDGELLSYEKAIKVQWNKGDIDEK